MRLALAAALALLVAAPAHALPRLHAQRGSDPAVLTADGRQVLLRGVNVNQLGDYYRQRPDLPATAPLSADDFRQIARLGMDSVRLIVSWSALEPQRGRFDATYLRRVRTAVDWAASAGLYVILDMHQDAWGKAIATPKGETCAPGFTAQQGWDGAPAWATLTDGLPTCRLAQREIAPAVAQAWQSFYDDRDGIQGELVATWARLARAFAADPAVAGYDLLNEPNPGFAPGVTDASLLGTYYQRAIAAIRAAERAAPHGFSHIAFFEPGVLWSALGTDTTPPFDEPDAVFAPHLYAGSLTIDGMTVEQGFQAAAQAAQQYGSTVWSGEWGWFGDPKADEPSIRAYAAQEDAHRWGGAWWQWKQACGDPHGFADGSSTQAPATSGNLFVFHCPDLAPLPMPAGTVRILSRPYARFAPGRLTRLTSDPDTGAFSLAGSAGGARGCRLVVWAPRLPRLTATGVRDLRARPSHGGFLVSGCARGDYALTGA